MKKTTGRKILTVCLLIAAVIITVELQNFMKRRAAACEGGVCSVPAEYAGANVIGPQTVPFTPPARDEAERPLPELLDFGSGQCAACKMMEVVLTELAREHGERLKIRLVDIQEQEELAKQYAVRMIPTQIFLDAAGNERFRHEGFISKDDILKKWAELGIEL